MGYDERKLCVMCAWRGTCQLKYSMPGGVALHCVEYTRDVTLREPEEEVRKRNVLLVGPKEIGKTALIKKILERTELRAAGYYTREVKEGLFRSCLEMVWLSGETRTLVSAKAKPGWIRLGKDYVNLEVVDAGLVPMLREALGSEQVELLVLDEVGRAECLSEQFRRHVVDCITSKKSVVATINAAESDDDFLHALQARSDVSVLHVGYENREALLQRVLFMLTGERARPGAEW